MALAEMSSKEEAIQALVVSFKYGFVEDRHIFFWGTIFRIGSGEALWLSKERVTMGKEA